MQSVVLDFSAADEAQQWRVINDGVMGGLSQSRIEITSHHTAIFRGTVSLENNGGFASVRRVPRSYELGGTLGLRLHVRGDGRTYQLRLRTGDDYDGVAYRASFAPQTEWSHIELRFEDFVPSFRGRVVRAPKLDPADVRQVGFLIADKKEGAFELEIDRIEAIPPSSESSD
ncbi:MAG: CIA30 family protein [Candidatus Latescibacterota bacterium]|nr:MAG: CIA30 family protein [Candidatus Latescibacterota bacterium]